MNTIATMTMAASTLLVTACSTHNLQLNQTVAKSGLTYVATANTLIDQTKSTVIDLDAKELWYLRKNKNKKQMLRDKSASTSKLLDEIEAFRSSISSTDQYHKALTALIEDPTREDLARSISEISITIANENMRQTEKVYPTATINEESISKLSQMAVTSHYSTRIRDILRKDAPIINRQLSLQKDQLKHIISMLHRRIYIGRAQHYKENVEKPFLESDRLTIDAWTGSRRQWFEMKREVPTVADLKEAHNSLRKAWMDVINGNHSIASVSNMLTDTSNASQAIKNLKKPPYPQSAIHAL